MKERAIKTPRERLNRHAPPRGARECWLWTGSTNGRYGVTFVGRRSDGTYRRIYAHRLAYELAHGPIFEGFEVDHMCREPLCVNPAHLQAVPRYVNFKRSRSIAAMWGERTECGYGHPFNLANTGWRANGVRYCRTCAREQMTKVRERRKSAGLRSDGKELRGRELLTECKRGHAYTPDNTIERRRGGRECRACVNLRARRRRQSAD